MSDENVTIHPEEIELDISVSITRNFGVEQVTVKISRTVSVASRDDRLIHYDTLYKILDDQLTHYAQTNLIHAPQNGQVNRMNSEDFAVNTRRMACEKITAEQKDGKVFYKAAGGEFTKFGVRVWDEVIKEAGLWDALQGKLSLTLAGFDMVIAMQGDKPRKVLRLIDRAV